MTAFARQIRVEIGPPGRPGRAYNDLRVDFRVDHTSDPEPSSAKIEIYNLADESVAMAEQPDSVVRLLAGYDGAPRLLFTGNPIKGGVRLERRGPDKVLSIEAQDGGRAYQTGHIALARAGEIAARSLILDAATQMGLPVARLTLGASKTMRDYAYSGPARQMLDELTRSTGSEWSIVDGTLVVSPIGRAAPEIAIVFSTGNGNLVGSPSPTDEGVEITGLLEPSMRPRRRFIVQSRRVNGIFRATSVAFVGSQYTREYYTLIDGEAV